MRGILTHLRGNVVAYIALFVALGGTSYAAFSLPAGQRRRLDRSRTERSRRRSSNPGERRSERTRLG